eukprot:Clim_evm2s141 gene=Clim_evmTU2s141
MVMKQSIVLTALAGMAAAQGRCNLEPNDDGVVNCKFVFTTNYPILWENNANDYEGELFFRVQGNYETKFEQGAACAGWALERIDFPVRADSPDFTCNGSWTTRDENGVEVTFGCNNENLFVSIAGNPEETPMHFGRTYPSLYLGGSIRWNEDQPDGQKGPRPMFEPSPHDVFCKVIPPVIKEDDQQDNDGAAGNPDNGDNNGNDQNNNDNQDNNQNQDNGQQDDNQQTQPDNANDGNNGGDNTTNEDGAVNEDAAANPDGAEADNTGDSGQDTGLYIGATVGAIAGVACLAGGIIYNQNRRKKASAAAGSDIEAPTPAEPMSEVTGDIDSQGHDEGETYDDDQEYTDGSASEPADDLSNDFIA